MSPGAEARRAAPRKAPPARETGSRYQQLRRGRAASGLTRAEVELHQRTRLYEAMVEITVSRGYAAMNIKAVCALAGVSRRTFYDLFGSDPPGPKEACFLNAYDFIVDRTTARVSLAYRAERDPEHGLRRAFEQFACEAVNEPHHARLALVEIPAAGPLGLARMQRTRLTVERMIGASFGESPHGIALPPLLAKGIVCGVERITRQRLLAGRIEELPSLADELLGWALAHRTPACAGLSAPSRLHREEPASRLPSARAGNDRARVLRCAARIAAAKGYAHLHPAQIACAAGISEARFHTLFESTEQCFLEALDRLGLEALVCVGRAARSSGDPLVGLHRGMVALMRHIATNPVLVRVAFVEIFAVGAPGIQRREHLLGQFARLLAGIMPPPPPPSDLTAEASIGAIWGIVHHHVIRGGAPLLHGLAGYATFIALAPVIGGDAAVEVILAGESRAPTSTARPPRR